MERQTRVYAQTSHIYPPCLEYKTGYPLLFSSSCPLLLLLFRYLFIELFSQRSKWHPSHRPDLLVEDRAEDVAGHGVLPLLLAKTMG